MGLAYFDSFTKYYVATSGQQAMVVYPGMPLASADPMERRPQSNLFHIRAVFEKRNGQIIGWRPRLRNPRSATG